MESFMPNPHYQRVLQQDQGLPAPLRWLSRAMSSWWTILLLGVCVVGYVAASHVPVMGKHIWQWRLFDTTQHAVLTWWPLMIAAWLLAAVILWSTMRRLPWRIDNLGAFVAVLGLAIILVSQTWAFRSQTVGIAAVPINESGGDETLDVFSLPPPITTYGDTHDRVLVIMARGSAPITIPLEGLPRWHDASGDVMPRIRLHDRPELASLIGYSTRITTTAYISHGDLTDRPDGTQTARGYKELERDYTSLPYPGDALLAIEITTDLEDGGTNTTTAWLPFEAEATDALAPKHFFQVEGLGSVGLSFRPASKKMQFAMWLQNDPAQNKAWLYASDREADGGLLQPEQFDLRETRDEPARYTAVNEDNNPAVYELKWANNGNPIADGHHVARALLGQMLVRQRDDGTWLAGLIVETEAYLGPEDRAAHTYNNHRSPRNESMWQQAGTAYVYFTYGMHHCMNVVTSDEQTPQAVLIRALQPVHNHQAMRLCRQTNPGKPAPRDTDLCSGPAKLCQALSIDRGLDGTDLATSEALWLEQARSRALPSSQIAIGPRIGIASSGDWARANARTHAMNPTDEPNKPAEPQAPIEPTPAPEATPEASADAPATPAVPEAAAAEAMPEPTAAAADIDAEVNAALGDQSIGDLIDQAEAEEKAKAKEEEEAFHHELRRGRISAIRGEDVFIDVTGETGKLQGVVPLQQFDRPPRLGSIMDFVVDHVDEAQGLMFLSREGAISRTTWDTIHKGSVVEARVTGHNKGGLELELVGNIRAFMPASQVDLHHVEDFEPYVGQKLEATVTEVDRKHKKVMLSRRSHLEHVRKSSKEKLLKTLEVGAILDGKVSNVVDYGAFIDIGGVDGLCHVSDLSYQHVTKPGDVVKPGDAVQVKVLKIDRDKGRIALGVKQVQPDPWDTATAGISAGAEVTGTVTRTANFGAFIAIGEGVEGLLPISEISWKRIGKCEDVISVGQSLRLKVLTFDPKKKKMSLSLKQIGGDPWADAVAKFAEDSWVQGKVVSTRDFGAFVELEEGVEGLVHISELADGRVKNVSDIVNVGDEKNFRIKSIDTDKRKLALSLRKDSGPRGGDRGGRGGKGGKEEVKLFKTTAKKQSKENLKGGMDLGGMGLGGLSMDDFK
eukprot:g14199.t1